ncbi:hypothetical protein JCM8547_006215 [Rhodosporidiobolus lusitaniae]
MDADAVDIPCLLSCVLVASAAVTLLSVAVVVLILLCKGLVWLASTTARRPLQPRSLQQRPPPIPTDPLLASLRTANNHSVADLTSLTSVSTSSPRPGASANELLARRLWTEEPQRFSRTLQDRTLARDLDEALRTGRNVEAVRAAREARSSPSTSSISASTSYVVCGDPPSSSLRLIPTNLPCKHSFCPSCLRGLFLHATTDETLFPPSCCRRPSSPLHEGMLLTAAGLSEDQRRSYEGKKREFAATEKDRVYCSNARCSVFLVGDGNRMRTKDVKCGKCGRETCTACRAPSHPLSTACALDSDASAATKLAKQLEGRRCEKCGRVVVRNGGCENVAVLLAILLAGRPFSSERMFGAMPVLAG